MLEEFFAGFIAGFAGLFAFFHTNFILKLSAPFLPSGFSKAVFSSSLSFSKLVFELVPTLFFFIPSLSYGISLLPAQRLFFQGKAFVVLKTTLACFFLSGLFSVVLLAPSFLILPFLFSLIHPWVGWVLLSLVFASVLSKDKKAESVFAFLLSGVLGLVLFSKPVLQEPLFPLLSGLFGIPAIFFSLNASIPSQQTDSDVFHIDVKVVLVGVVLGALSGLLPAMTPVFLVSLLFLVLEPVGEMIFIQAVASTLVSKTFFDFVAFTVLGKARSGAVAFASAELSREGLVAALAAGLAALFLAVALTLLLCKGFAYAKVDASVLGVAALGLVLAGVFFFNGFLGLFVLCVSACVGVGANLLGVNKTMLLGALLLPSLAFYFGLSLF